MRGARRRGSVVAVVLALGCGPGTGGGESGASSGEGTSSGAAEGTTGTGAPTTSGDTTGGTTGGVGSTGTTTFDPNSCGAKSMFYSIVGANVMLVVDKSGSMVADPNGLWDDDRDDQDGDGFKDFDPAETATPKVTRWATLHGVLGEFAAEYERTLDLGVMLFPSIAATAEAGEGACLLGATPELTPGPLQATALAEALPAADDPAIAGARPAARAVEQATEALLAIADDRPATLVLFSRGAANCGEAPLDLLEDEDTSLAAAVEAAFMQGIETRVIGVGVADEVSPVAMDGEPDGVNARDRLAELAGLGGTALFDAQHRYDLQAALRATVDELLSCTVPLSDSPIYWEYAEVHIEDEYYGRPEQTWSCAELDGWQFTSDAHDTVRLCGEACDHFRRYGELDIQFRCASSE